MLCLQQQQCTTSQCGDSSRTTFVGPAEALAQACRGITMQRQFARLVGLAAQRSSCAGVVRGARHASSGVCVRAFSTADERMSFSPTDDQVQPRPVPTSTEEFVAARRAYQAEVRVPAGVASAGNCNTAMCGPEFTVCPTTRCPSFARCTSSNGTPVEK